MGGLSQVRVGAIRAHSDLQCCSQAAVNKRTGVKWRRTLPFKDPDASETPNNVLFTIVLFVLEF